LQQRVAKNSAVDAQRQSTRKRPSSGDAPWANTKADNSAGAEVTVVNPFAVAPLACSGSHLRQLVA